MMTEAQTGPIESLSGTEWYDTLNGTAAVSELRQPTRQPDNATGLHQPMLRAGSSTELPENDDALYDQLATMLSKAEDEYFEDGIESDLARDVSMLIESFDTAAVMELAYRIFHEKVSEEVAAEALRTLGEIEQSSSSYFRLRLLEESLAHASPMVRDGAVLGLESLDNPHAIPYLEQAIRRERYVDLRSYMEEVFARLETAS